MEERIIRHLQGLTTESEERELLSWCEASPTNMERYQELRDLWAALPRRRARTSPPPAEHLVAMVREAADRRAARKAERTVGEDVGEAAAPSIGRQRDRTRRGAAAALLAASVAVLGFGLGVLSERVTSPEAELSHREITTRPDAGATVTLSDGTAVTLGASSNLRVIEEGENPVVRLEGRAYFGVVPDPSRTFTVRTAYGDAVALGTRFEVRTEDRELRIVVAQGNVRVSAAGRSVEIGEGMMSRNTEDGSPATSRVEDVEALLEWIGQTLVFRATRLDRAISEIERRYGVTVDLEDTSLSELEVTATFTDQPLEDVVFVICTIVNAGCAIEGDRIRIGDRTVGVPPSEMSPRIE